MRRAHHLSLENTATNKKSQFIAYAYCGMALFTLLAALGIRFAGAHLGLSIAVAYSVSNGFAVVAVLDLVALFLIELLNDLLRAGEP